MNFSKAAYRIFNGQVKHEIKLDEFNAVTVDLEAGLKADLNWTSALAQADEAINRGFKIFWNLQLGLFEKLNSPMSNHPQFLNLQLAVEHFNKTVWPKYNDKSLGVCFFQGSSRFEEHFLWGKKEITNFQEHVKSLFGSVERASEYVNEYMQSFENLQPDQFTTIEWKKVVQQFCQSSAIDYLKLIAEELHDDAEPFAAIDISTVQTLSEQAYWQETTLATPLRFVLCGSKLPLNHQLAWNSGISPLGYIVNKTEFLDNNAPKVEFIPTTAALAVYMPSSFESKNEIKSTLNWLFDELNKKGLHYRLISEDRLTVEWDGLDHLIVISKAISPISKRMLKGFCAAGGTVVYADNAVGVDEEMPLEAFYKHCSAIDS